MPEDLLHLARALAGRARPGEQVEAYASRVNETDVRVLDGEVESLTVAERSGVGVRVVVDGRQGFSWVGALDPQLAAGALEEARDNARFATPDEAQGLPEPQEPDDAPTELALWREELRGVATRDKVDLALAVEAAARAGHPLVRGVESAGYGDGLVESAIASSLGVVATTRRSSCSCSVSVLVGEGAGTQTGYGFSAGRAFTELDVERAAGDAVHRAVRLLGAAPVPSCSLPVVLDPLVTRSILGLVGAACNGEAVLKGRSMLAGRLGESVAPAHVTLVDDPTCAAAFGAAPHDAEGVATRRNVLVDAGVLRGFLYDTVAGRRAGCPSTGSAVRGGFASTPGVGARALALAPGSRSPDEIVAGLDEALYVQSVSGLHSGANPVSGDFSVGIEGLLIRDGALGAPVREMTVASTLPRMLLDLVEVGSDLEWLPGAAAGVTVLIGEMALGGS